MESMDINFEYVVFPFVLTHADILLVIRKVILARMLHCYIATLLQCCIPELVVMADEQTQADITQMSKLSDR